MVGPFFARVAKREVGAEVARIKRMLNRKSSHKLTSISQLTVAESTSERVSESVSRIVQSIGGFGIWLVKPLRESRHYEDKPVITNTPRSAIVPPRNMHRFFSETFFVNLTTSGIVMAPAKVKIITALKSTILILA